MPWASLRQCGAKLQLQEDLAKRMRAATVRAHGSANDADAVLPAAADAAALQADHKAVLVILRMIARDMGERFSEEVESKVTAALEPARLLPSGCTPEHRSASSTQLPGWHV